MGNDNGFDLSSPLDSLPTNQFAVSDLKKRVFLNYV